MVEAATAWVYVPDGAPTAITDEYALVGYPDTFAMPTQVARLRSRATPAELVDEVEQVAAGWGRTELAWWIDAGTTPIGLESYLQVQGATLAETVTVLAVDLTRPPPAFEVPSGVVARVADDRAALRTFGAVTAEGWEHGGPGEPDLDRWLAEAGHGHVRVVGLVDGEPCATGGMTLVDDVARLWAGVTLPRYRGRGAYRAVLAERLRVARERGATIGLVKGRVSTSAPILRRLGFDVFDDERAYRRPVGG